MKTMSILQRYSLLVITSLLALPLTSSAILSDEEVRHVLNHEDESYLYCDRSHSQIAEVMEEITRWDNNKNSPAWQLHDHIRSGYNIGEENAIIQALTYAEGIINNRPHDAQTLQTRKKLNTVMQAVVEGNLDVDIYSEEQLRNICGEDLRNDIIKVREKLYVFANAKFFKNVEFKDRVDFENFVRFHGNVRFSENVSIEGTLSVTDEVIGCDLTVGCNINMNDSVSPAIGNIVKNGARFIHNFGTNNTFAGSNAGNFTMTGGQNSAFGTDALTSNSLGQFNTAVGRIALSSNTAGNSNTAMGENSLTSNTVGAQNTALGSAVLPLNTIGNNNTALGFNSLPSVTTGNNNIAVGVTAGSGLTTGSNNVYIGLSAVAAGESNVTRIRNIRGTATGVADAIAVLIDSTGQLGTVSSTRRVKHAIENMGNASANIYKLRPVTFVYNGDASETRQYGLIAEEADQVFPDIVVDDENGQPFTVQYHVLPVLLLNEVQRLRAGMVASHEALARRIAQLEARA